MEQRKNMDNYNDIFISYSRKDLELVRTIKTEIEQATGARCWMDLEDIESGTPLFTQTIINGIEECKVFLFMRSIHSQESKYAMLELSYANEDALCSHVIILNIDDSKMSKEFRFLYSLTDTINWNDQLQHDKLLFDIRRWTGTEEGKEVKHIKEEKGDNKKTEVIREEDVQCETTHKTKKRKKKIILGLLLPTIVIIGLFAMNLFGTNNRFIYIGTPSEGLAQVEDNNKKWGFIDNTNTIVIPCDWEFTHCFSEGLACVMDANGKWGFIDKNGTVVIPCEWNYAHDFSEDMACVEDATGKKGFIDKTGSLVIPCKWYQAYDFREGMACVEDAIGKKGFIDKTGILAIACTWYSVCNFQEGLARVKDLTNEWFYIDKTGKVLKKAHSPDRNAILGK